MGMNDQPMIIAGRYVLAGEPRVGGMGRVYKAVDIGRDAATVAVKILAVPDDVEGIQATLFERERRNLAGLQHPNVVRLLGAGRLDDGVYYLILEWVERSLLEAHPPGAMQWDDFARRVGMPMLAGLAHAHERHIVHRDVKPSNVLIDDAGTPRLVDFGISKLKSRLTDGDLTVAGFGSAPYTPPGDPTSSSYSRDVYGAAVTFLACLTTVTIDSYAAVARAREALAVPGDIGDILDRALSADPLERPENASVFRDELAACQRRRHRTSVERKVVYLSLTRSALDSVGAAAGQVDDEAVRRTVERDLADGAHLASRRDYDVDGQPRVPDEFFLYGARHRYLLLRKPQQATLTVVAAPVLQPARLDEARGHAWEAPYTWSAQRPVDATTAVDNLRLLVDGLEEFYLDQDEQRTKRAEHRLFNQWLDLLAAKSEMEARGERPLGRVS